MTERNHSDDMSQLEKHIARLIEARTQGGKNDDGVSGDELHGFLEQLHDTAEELRQQNEALLEDRQDVIGERQRYQEFFDSLPDAHLLTDGNGIIREANVASVQLFRAPERAFLVGKPLASLMASGDSMKLRNLLGRLVKGRTTASEELQLQPRKDEPPFAALITASVVSWQTADSPAQVRWQFRDLTEQKMLEQHLRQTEKQLEQSTRLASLGMMTAGMVQEITDRVATIQLVAQMALRLRNKPNESAEVYTALDSIVESSKRCGDMAHNMVRYAKDRPTKKWFHDVNAVVLSALQRVREFVPQRGLPVRTELAINLPKVVCDPLELELIIVNLVRNAIESGASGIEVGLATRAKGSKVQIEIKDNGTGMTHQQRLRAFEPFYTTKQALGSLGLGLSVARTIVVAHGGSIDLHTELGQGTRVCIELPAADDAP